jgi:hypothetical protein
MLPPPRAAAALALRRTMSATASTPSTQYPPPRSWQADDLVSDVDAVVAAGVQAFLAMPADAQRAALAELGEASPPSPSPSPSSTPLRLALRRAVTASPDAIDFLAAVRARCIDTAAAGKPWARAVDAEARDALAPLYGASLLRLRHLAVPPPAAASAAAAAPTADRALLYELARQAQASETVHKTSDDVSFRRKFGRRRLVASLAHSARPDDLLAVLYCALLPQVPKGMAEIDEWSGGEPGAAGQWTLQRLAAEEGAGGGSGSGSGSGLVPGGADDGPLPRLLPRPTTAVFYSVGSPNLLTRGLGMGSRIIYALAGEIASSAPGIHTFVTLSPIPEFLRWLLRGAPAGNATTAPLDALLARAKLDLGARMPIVTASQLAAELSSTSWATADGGRRAAALHPLLAWLCRHYLLRVRSGAGPSCKVAAFHLGNGARMARICAFADGGEAGIRRSAGFMVNYEYSARGAEGLRETMLTRAAAYARDPTAVLDAQDPVHVEAAAWTGLAGGPTPRL